MAANGGSTSSSVFMEGFRHAAALFKQHRTNSPYYTKFTFTHYYQKILTSALAHHRFSKDSFCIQIPEHVVLDGEKLAKGKLGYKVLYVNKNIKSSEAYLWSRR